MHKAENSMIVVDGTSQQQIEDFDDLIDEDTLFTAEDSKMFWVTARLDFLDIIVMHFICHPNDFYEYHKAYQT